MLHRHANVLQHLRERSCMLLFQWLPAPSAPCRLSPCDCHRLFASVSGRVVKISRQGTRFMASMWVSTHSNLDVLTENERLIMEFDNPVFGTVVQVSSEHQQHDWS
jgi:hypothetical protein